MKALKRSLRYLIYQLRSEVFLRPTLLVNGMMIIISCYIINVLLPEIDSMQMWLSIYWVITFLAVTLSFANCFSYELGGGHFFVFQLLSAEELYLLKVCFNMFKSMILHVIVFAIMQLFFFQEDLWSNLNWWVLIVMSSLCQASALTMIAALSEKTALSSTLYSVMGLPLLMTLVWLVAGFSIRLIINEENIGQFLSMSMAFLLLLFAMSLFLFSYLWKD